MDADYRGDLQVGAHASPFRRAIGPPRVAGNRCDRPSEGLLHQASSSSGSREAANDGVDGCRNRCDQVADQTPVHHDAQRGRQSRRADELEKGPYPEAAPAGRGLQGCRLTGHAA